MQRLAKKCKNMTLLKRSPKLCLLFHKFKTNTNDFGPIVAAYVSIRDHIKRQKLYRKISLGPIKLWAPILLQRLARKYKI